VDDLLTDQQQAEVVRSWLRENGLWLLGGVVLGVAGLFGWFQWQAYQAAQAETASALFDEFRKEATAGNGEAAEAKLRELATGFADSGYTDQARLVMARLQLDRNDPNKAAEYLRQVANGAADANVRYLATLRLGRLLIFQEQAAEALEVLSPSAPAGWAPAFHAARGDAYYALGKRAEARSEYERALRPAETPGIDRGYVQAKLDDLGGPTTAPAPAAPAAAPGTATP
jgi:predicted negative regulator of RcsB-dependent stress response